MADLSSCERLQDLNSSASTLYYWSFKRNVYWPLIYSNLDAITRFAWDRVFFHFAFLPKQYRCLLCQCKPLFAAFETIRHCLVQAYCSIFRTLAATIYFLSETVLLCTPGWTQAHCEVHGNTRASASQLWDYWIRHPSQLCICYVNYKHFPHWFLCNLSFGRRTT